MATPLVKSALRWLQAALGGVCVTSLLMSCLASRVREAESALLRADPELRSAPAPACQQGFAIAGSQPLRLATRVGHRAWPGGGFVPIPGARLYAVEGSFDFDLRLRERLAAVSGGDGELEFVWERRFADRYACGELTDAWKQTSQLYLLRAPGCDEREIVVSSAWAPPRVMLVCWGRLAPPARAL